MVMSTGTMVPRWFSVAALYCLQNSMVCTPWGPRAVPTGGAGVAPPAGSWIFTTARTFFFLGGMAGGPPADLELGDLAEFELDRGLPAEDVDQHLQFELVLVDLVDLAGEVGEGPFLHAHRLAHLVLQAGAGLLDGLGATLHLDLEDALHLAPRQRRGLGPGADEPGDAGGVADHRPGVVVEVAPGEEVAGENLLLDHDLLAVLELDDVLHGDHDLEDPVLHVHRDDPALEVGLHLVLVAGVGVDHEPPPGPVVGALDDGELLLLVVEAGLVQDFLDGLPKDLAVVLSVARQPPGYFGDGVGCRGGLESSLVGQHVGTLGQGLFHVDGGGRGNRTGPEVVPGFEIGGGHDLNRKMTACEKA